MFYVDLAVSGVVFGCMYALMAVGLTLVYGLLRILHIAHAAVFALGAYVTVLVANVSGSILLGFVAAIAVTPLCGIAIYRILYQPLLHYRPDVPMIASIGLLVFMQDGFRISFGEQGVTFVQNPLAIESVDVAGITLTFAQLAVLVVTLLIFVALHLFYDADAHRRGVARYSLQSEHGRELRRRRDPRAISEFRHRFGACRGRRRPHCTVEQFCRSNDRVRGELQGAGNHRARRTRQRARHARREPLPRARRILRHEFYRFVPEPRCDRVFGADPRSYGAPPGLYRSRTA